MTFTLWIVSGLLWFVLGIGYSKCKKKILTASETHGRVWFYKDAISSEFLVSPLKPSNVSCLWKDQHKLAIKEHSLRWDE